MDPGLARRLKYAAPYAQDDEILPPVGTASDFVFPDRPLSDVWRPLLERPDREWARRLARVDPAQLEQAVGRDRWPLPAAINREGYCGDDHMRFWLSGFSEHLMACETAAAHGVHGGRFYDFGGGTGRIFRHFAAQSDAWEVWSSDFRLSSVAWNLAHYPPALKLFANTSTPGLPLPDGEFDLVTAFSVFTHINEAETQWLLELRRILKVGGLAYLTIHDETTWRTADALRSQVAQSLGVAEDAPLPPGKTVMTYREDDPYNCQVFHAADHLKQVWSRFFEIVEVKPLWVGAQTAVVCRRTR